MYYTQNTEGYIINIKDKSLIKDIFSDEPIHLDNAIIIHEKVETQNTHKEYILDVDDITEKANKEAKHEETLKNLENTHLSKCPG